MLALRKDIAKLRDKVYPWAFEHTIFNGLSKGNNSLAPSLKMATDRQPLLKPDDEDDDNGSSFRRRDYQSNNVGLVSDSAHGEPHRISLSASTSLATLAESDFIAAIFVVAFDTRSGLQSSLSSKLLLISTNLAYA